MMFIYHLCDERKILLQALTGTREAQTSKLLPFMLSDGLLNEPWHYAHTMANLLFGSRTDGRDSVFIDKLVSGSTWGELNAKKPFCLHKSNNVELVPTLWMDRLIHSRSQRTQASERNQTLRFLLISDERFLKFALCIFSFAFSEKSRNKFNIWTFHDSRAKRKLLKSWASRRSRHTKFRRNFSFSFQQHIRLTRRFVWINNEQCESYVTTGRDVTHERSRWNFAKNVRCHIISPFARNAKEVEKRARTFLISTSQWVSISSQSVLERLVHGTDVCISRDTLLRRAFKFE